MFALNMVQKVIIVTGWSAVVYEDEDMKIITYVVAFIK